MESGSKDVSDEDLRARARIAVRAASVPHTVTASTPWWTVAGGAGAAAAANGTFWLIIHEDVLWLGPLTLLAVMLAPTAAWMSSALTRRRHGIAPDRHGRPPVRSHTRPVALATLALEALLLTLAVIAPLWLAVAGAFVATAVLLLAVGRARERALLRVRESGR